MDVSEILLRISSDKRLESVRHGYDFVNKCGILFRKVHRNVINEILNIGQCVKNNYYRTLTYQLRVLKYIM